MSFLPEKYMCLNSLGIGMSGLISLLINSICLLGFDNKRDFARTMTVYTINFFIMTGVSIMYFFERRSRLALYYINLACIDLILDKNSQRTNSQVYEIEISEKK